MHKQPILRNPANSGTVKVTDKVVINKKISAGKSVLLNSFLTSKDPSARRLTTIKVSTGLTERELQLLVKFMQCV